MDAEPVHKKKKKGTEKAEKRDKKERKRKERKERKERKLERKRAKIAAADSSSSSSELEQAASAPAAAVAARTSCFSSSYPTLSRRYASSAIIGHVVGDAERRQRDERAARFAQSEADAQLRVRASAPQPRLQPGEHVRGTSMALEKSYLRLTALPRADDVRPLTVLIEAFDNVRQRWRRHRDYPYACEQLKAIRQDLTVQHLTSATPRARFATLVYEAHARIALEAADFDEFAQCQSQLRPLHRFGLSSCHAEFVAYRLLHCIALRGEALAEELNGILSPFTWANGDGDGASTPSVQQALKVAVAVQGSDWATLFREAARMRHLGGCILRPVVEAQRRRALWAACKVFAPNLELRRAASFLGFGCDEAACTEWLRAEEAVLSRGAGNTLVLDGRSTRQALRNGPRAGPPTP
eukprot:CAMPEP_0119365068 /NCGR_PEP_ID=MMETSP1334-20130426/11999_1 /TAXON_ID=127549 /ORGANISM="Calcidiscus leptoporus, Strain RCC1130" /LENGTH=411 /DNA_ID=CAMNT_0007380939 /DNA_START=100 /DNA_END=1335 /DNA_ORIENTATION=-